MKKILVTILFILFFCTSLAYGQTDVNESTLTELDINSMINEQLSKIEVDDWQPYLRYIDQYESSLTGQTNFKETLIDLISGKFKFSWKGLFKIFVDNFFKEVNYSLTLMGEILVISLICGIFQTLNDSFENQSVGEIGYFVCYSIVIILIVQSLLPVFNIGKIGIERMVNFMQILYPTLITFLVALGNYTSSAIMNPAIGILLSTISTILKNILMPLIALSAVLIIVNNISSKVQVKKLSKFLNNLCVWILALIFTIFIGVMTIQGFMSSSVDGVSIRTAKFALDTFVPVIGKMLSQSLDTVVGCALLVKNAVGVAGLIILILLALSPAVKILTLIFIYKLSSSLLEPVTDRRLVDCIDGIGNVLTILLLTVLGIALMFYLTIALIIGTGSMFAIIR